VNWSDESYRKMSTKITIWGANGRITADRQECQAYLRKAPAGLEGYQDGWNVHYTTDLTDEVWFYVRGEEYSAQVDHFAQSVAARRTVTESSFASAAQTDDILTMIREDAERGPAALAGRPAAKAPAPKRFSLFGGKA
jgi:predicted dehydrogenase